MTDNNRGHSVALMILLIGITTTAGCFGSCFGSNEPRERTTQRLDPYGFEVDLLPGMTGGANAQGYQFVSGDGSSFIRVQTAPPGPAAGQRTPATLLAHLGVTPVEVQWTAPCSVGASPCLQARMTSNVPTPQVHWVAIIDGPQGPVLINSYTSQQYITSATMGDSAWRNFMGAMRAVGTAQP